MSKKMTTLKKQFVRPAAPPNPEPALEVFDHQQFNLVIAAAARAREIQTERRIASRDDPTRTYLHQPTVAALDDFGSGRLDPEEYLIRAGRQDSNTRSRWS